MPDFIRKNGRRLLISLYALALFLLNFIRIFDNNFWGDETYTIRLAQMRLPAMFAETAGDVHPPLYYILVKLIGGLLGYRGEVFHFISLIPYGIILVLALTVLQKLYGMTTSLILITLASLLPTAVQYNVEVRMYSWGAFFVLLSYLFLWKIMSRNRWRDYAGFVIFSLSAAYTHYYCLISVAFFYLFLFGIALIRRKCFLKKTLLSCGVTVAGYMPWFFTLLQTLERTTDDFWMMWIPTLKECIAFFFKDSCQYLLFAILMAGVAAFFLRQILPSKTSGVAAKETTGEVFEVSVRLRRLTLNVDALWVLAGLFSMFGTIFVGIVVSRLIRPLFIVRYLYPVSIVAWLILGFCLSRLKGKIVYTAAVLCIIFLTCIPQYCTTYINEYAENESLKATLAVTAGEFKNGDVILTDLASINWTVSDYYYPGITHQLITLDELSNLTPGVSYWLILESPLSEDNGKQLSKQGYFWEEKVQNGILGTSTVSIYKLMS